MATLPTQLPSQLTSPSLPQVSPQLSPQIPQPPQSPQLPDLPKPKRRRVPLPTLPSATVASRPPKRRVSRPSPKPVLSREEKQKRKTAREKDKGRSLDDPEKGVQATQRCAHCKDRHLQCRVALDPVKFKSWKCGSCIASKIKCSFSIENPGCKFDPQSIKQNLSTPTTGEVVSSPTSQTHTSQTHSSSEEQVSEVWEKGVAGCSKLSAVQASLPNNYVGAMVDRSFRMRRQPSSPRHKILDV
ncbi:hypothetical protein F5Y12DRAFT_798338 [Xylaria sp. FL1777]|nr:hypothetical protein F5Y12DRAFT_798338 [Xylaria sp. FL1777]